MSLRIVVGPMFAGKTSEIQSVVRRYGCLNKKVLVITADIDNRYQNMVTSVVNHDLDNITDKYKRRYNRLLAIIQNKERVLFISVNHYDNIYNNVYKKDSLIKLYDLLYKYNPNIDFIAINYESYNFTHNTLKHIALDCNRGIPFSDSKSSFTQTLNNYMACLMQG